MSYETILYETKDRVATITLNRPDKRNALNDTMLFELEAAFLRAGEDAEASCVVLTGAGDKAFCAGADLGGFSGGDGFYASYEARGAFPRLFLAMERLPKPTLAAVNGACVAGGFGLMMACDLAIAKAGVKMGTPEIARGLFPYMISALIGRAVARRRVFEMMFLGELFTSEDAAAWDVINKVVPAESYEAEVLAWSGKLASHSPAVMALGKKAFVQQAGMPLEGALSYLQGLLSVNVMMEDAAEGISAFFEKRPPAWKGR